MNKSLLLVTLIIVSISSYAGDIEKAFKYLNTGDYANAQKYLREAITDEPENAAANYGLAKFYFLKDNKSYNVDSANFYIKRSAEKIPLNPDDKQTKKFLNVGVRDYTIQALQQEINQGAYAVAEKNNTVESYQAFVDNYTDKGLLNRATSMRNQLAFIRANGANDPDAMDLFIKKYPGADQIEDAKKIYEKRLYEQVTVAKNYESYKSYMDKYPNGAHFTEAKKNYEDKLLEYYNGRHNIEKYLEFEKLYKSHPAYNAIEDSIYVLSTSSGNVEAYKNFVRSCKNNPNYSKAWVQLYLLATAEATEASYNKFLEDYTDFPDKQRVYKDLTLAKQNPKPFQQGAKWGYAIQPAPDSLTILIPIEYEEAFAFNSGLAAVRSVPCTEAKCNYFYIDKGNNRAFKQNFNFAGDFVQGFAIVGIGNCEVDSCKYGVIDRIGNWVIQPVYDEMNDPTEGLYLVSQKDRYGFINRNGESVISLKYTNALPFSEGAAAVALDSNWFFIDKNGKQLFIDFFHDVSSFKSDFCAVTKDGENWGYINKSGTFMIQPLYTEAEDFDGDFAIVSKKEKDSKHPGLFIGQRYKIDKNGKVMEKLTAPKQDVKKGKKKGSRR